MSDPQLQQYLSDQILQGYTSDQLKSVVMQSGWTEDQFNAAISDLQKP